MQRDTNANNNNNTCADALNTKAPRNISVSLLAFQNLDNIFYLFPSTERSCLTTFSNTVKLFKNLVAYSNSLTEQLKWTTTKIVCCSVDQNNFCSSKWYKKPSYFSWNLHMQYFFYSIIITITTIIICFNNNSSIALTKIIKISLIKSRSSSSRSELLPQLLTNYPPKPPVHLCESKSGSVEVAAEEK